MPFTGKSYESILKERTRLRKQAEKYNLELLEQFKGIEEKKKFEEHAYGPMYIAEKYHSLIKKADILIADYSGHSIGRDCEIIIAKEIFDKRVIAIIPNKSMRNHPWIRLYSDYIVSDLISAFKLANKLSALPLSSEISMLSREQKDKIDLVAEKNYSDLRELIPTELLRRWEALFGKDYKEVLKVSFEKLPQTLRVNLLKTSLKDFDKLPLNNDLSLSRLPFSPTAFRLRSSNNKNAFTSSAYKKGLIYVQEYASMLPVLALNPKQGDSVLDIAAAPGSKTTQLAELMNNKGKIIANDISKERLELLKKAAKRQGIKIIKPKLGDGSKLGNLYPNKFDKVLVDGPCSNEGIIRYKFHKLLEWSLLLIYHLQEGQFNLLESGFKALKPGGTLVYSTCSFGPEENEGIVQKLLQTHTDAILDDISFPGVKTRKGLLKWEHRNFDKSMQKTVRIYPQDNNTIGFFIAKIEKRKQKVN